MAGAVALLPGGRMPCPDPVQGKPAGVLRLLLIYKYASDMASE